MQSAHLDAVDGEAALGWGRGGGHDALCFGGERIDVALLIIKSRSDVLMEYRLEMSVISSRKV